MRRVVLIFPDTIRLAEFILHHNIKATEVNTEYLTVTTTLSDFDLVDACTTFGAVLQGQLGVVEDSFK